MAKAKKRTKRKHRTPQELLQAEYEKSQMRAAVDDDGWMDALVSQGGRPAPAVELNERKKQVKGPTPLPVSEATSPALVPLLLTMAQVCELLNVSRTTFYRMRQSGEIPGAVTIAGQLRYHRETIEKWILTKLEPSS